MILVFPVRNLLRTGCLIFSGLWPNSDGMTRFTPAARAPSTMGICSPMAALAMAMTTASCPERALVTDSTEVRSALRTSTFSGNVELDDSRVMAVTLKPAARRALVIGTPMLPEACDEVSILHDCTTGC